MAEVTFNLWDADEYGDGSSKGKQLTAYIWEDGETITDVFMSVSLSDDDYNALSADDDSWHMDGDPLYPALLELFVLNQLLEKSK
jgi:hypothetical protein